MLRKIIKFNLLQTKNIFKYNSCKLSNSCNLIKVNNSIKVNNVSNVITPIGLNVLIVGILVYNHYYYEQDKINKLKNKTQEIIKNIKNENIQFKLEKLDILYFNKSHVIQTLYNFYNGKNIQTPIEFINIIKQYYFNKLNYLLYNIELFETKDRIIFNNLKDKLLKIYNYIKNDEIFNFNLIKLSHIELLILNFSYLCSNEKQKFIFETIGSDDFFTNLYYLNKKYEILTNYIVIYILINYLEYSLNQELNTNINLTFLNKKYGFAIDIIKDFISSNTKPGVYIENCKAFKSDISNYKCSIDYRFYISEHKEKRLFYFFNLIFNN